MSDEHGWTTRTKGNDTRVARRRKTMQHHDQARNIGVVLDDHREATIHAVVERTGPSKIAKNRGNKLAQ